MFKCSVDERLSFWANYRLQIDQSPASTLEILEDLWELWRHAPFIPYNNKIDPYFQYGWPTPWEILVENRYDEFTRSLMMGWTLKATKRFKDSRVYLKTLVDNTKSSNYNIVSLEDMWILNFSDAGPVIADHIPSSLVAENIIELAQPR